MGRHICSTRVVRVSEHELIGEILEMHDDRASNTGLRGTSGLGPGGLLLYQQDTPLSVELGPRSFGKNIFDSWYPERPLEDMRQMVGSNIPASININALDRAAKVGFQACPRKGDKVAAGDIIGTVQENEVFECTGLWYPSGTEGTITDIKRKFTVEETVASVKKPLTAKLKTYIDAKMARYGKKGPTTWKTCTQLEPLITGQRIIDTLFPGLQGRYSA